MSRSIGFGAIKSLIANNTPFSELIEYGIDEGYFEGKEKLAYFFIKDFKYKHDKYPEFSTVSAECGGEIEWESLPTEPVEYWASQLRERKQFNLCKEASNKITELLHGNKTKDTVQLLRYYNDQIAKTEEGFSLKDIGQIQNDAIERHNEIQINPSISGIPFGFSALDEMTYGQQGGDLTILIGETRVGKSYLSLYHALQAYLMGFDVLFLSPEMPESQIARRLLALQANLSESDLRKGKLSYYAVEKARNIANKPIDIGGNHNYFKILPSGMFTDVNKIISIANEYKPHLLVTDGLYLLHDYSIKGGSAWQETESIIFKLKNFGIHANIPTLGITQYNRAKPNNLSGAKGSMSVEFTASNFLSFEFENPEDRDSAKPVQYRLLKTKKSRDGDMCILRIKMDFRKMAITQDAVITGPDSVSDDEPEFIDDEFIGTL